MVNEKEPRMNEAQKELLRQYQEYCKGRLARKRRKDLKKYTDCYTYKDFRKKIVAFYTSYGVVFLHCS